MADGNKNLEACKFSVNDVVLCYEPDPLKARVLYDAKILDTDVTKDDKGKKVFEYYIHFQGWNKSWDRWVLEDQILRINETNRALQAKLYEKAKKKKAKARKRDDSSDDEKSNDSVSTSGDSSNSDDVKTSQLPLVTLDIPKVIAVRLEDDCYNIKRKKTLVHLPRTPSVNEIFNEYYSHCEKIVKTSEGRDMNLNVAYELIHGLNTYFNFYVFSLLLYNFEREQYYKFFPPGKENQPINIISPSSTPSKKRPIPSNCIKLSDSPRSNSAANTVCGDGVSPVLLKEALKTNSKRRKSCSVDEMTEGSPSKRKRNGSSGSTIGDSKDGCQVNMLKELTVEIDGNLPNRLARSAKKISSENEKNGKSDVKNYVVKKDGDKNHVTEPSAGSNLDNSPLSSIDNNCNGLRRSVRSTKSTNLNGDDDQEPLPIGSTAKTLNASRQRRNRNRKNKKAPVMETDEKSFFAYPQNSNGNTPADIYGLEHLLRLFVKLPILLSCTNVEEEKMNVIIQYVTKFLDYLSKRTDLFVDQTLIYSESII